MLTACFSYMCDQVVISGYPADLELEFSQYNLNGGPQKHVWDKPKVRVLLGSASCSCLPAHEATPVVSSGGGESYVTNVYCRSRGCFVSALVLTQAPM